MNASRGFVMIAVLVALLLVAAIALLLTTETGGEADRAGRAAEALQADYAVLAALEHAAWNVDRGTCASYTLPTTVFGNHSYSVTYSAAAGSPIDITATGTLGSGISRTRSRAQIAAHQTSSTLTLQLGATAGADVRVDESSPTSNSGGATNLRVSANPSARSNALLRFDVSSIPYGAHIVSARLELRMWSLQTPGTAAVRQVSRAWVEGTRNGGGTADGATWNTYDATNAWTTAGGDFSSEVVSRTAINSGDTWVAFELAPLVQKWLTGEPNLGVALVGEGALRMAEFSSRETNAAADRPKLTITYACECGVACATTEGSGKVLMVTSNGGTPSAVEAVQKTIFESWGYTVDTLDQTSGQTTYDTKVAANDVVFVPASANPALVATKLTASTKGVVSANVALNDELGLSASSAYATGDTLTIASNSHYITQPFGLGALRIYAADMEANLAGGSAAPGLQPLGTWSASPSLAVLQAGAQKYGGGTAAARRVLLPLGRNVDWRYLNNNGRLIVQRALDWGGSLVGPTAHWKLDDAAGTTAIDSEGGHHGTLVGGPAWATGQIDGALDFDGVDDYVNLTSDAALDNIFASAAGVAAWINPATFGENNYGRVLDKDNNLTLPGSGWALEFDGPGARLLLQRGFSTAGGEWATPIGSIALNAWQHIAVVYDGAAAANDPVIYLNGIAQTLTERRTPSGTPTSDAALTLRLGNYAADTSRTFDGRIDDVRIYKRVLDAAEIAALAASGGAAHAVLVVVADPSNPSAAAAARKALMESWGHTVTLIDDSGSQASFDAAVSVNDVAYIAAEAVTSSLGNKLTAATLGVVNENRTTAGNLGLVADSFDAVTGTSLVIEDNTHFITAEFPLGALTMLTASGVLHAKDDDLAPDIVRLGSRTGFPSFVELAVIDQGGVLWGGSASAGRRVQLPWGDSAFNVNALTADGRKLMQRAIEWGAGSGAGGSFGGSFGGGSCSATTFADDFESQNYAGSTGMSAWATNWLEINESDGPAGGDETITSSGSGGGLRARVQDNDGGGEGLAREANLTGYSSATLSLTYRRTGLDDANDYVTIDVSSNGGGTWTELARLAGPTNDGSAQPGTYDITSHISGNTRIRMLTSSAMGGSDFVDFDDVVIAASNCP